MPFGCFHHDDLKIIMEDMALKSIEKELEQVVNVLSPIHDAKFDNQPYFIIRPKNRTFPIVVRKMLQGLGLSNFLLEIMANGATR